MNTKTNLFAAFNENINNLRNVLISENDVKIEITAHSGLGKDSYEHSENCTWGAVHFNYAGAYTTRCNIGMHLRIMDSDGCHLPATFKPSDFELLFKNGYRGGNGRDTYKIVSTPKIEKAAQKCAEILKQINKATNQQLSKKCFKAKIDFWLVKELGFIEAVVLMKKIRSVEDGLGSGLYSKDNEEKAWYSNKELSISFWQFGKSRRSNLFEKRTGISIPSSNKDLPLLEKQVNRILTSTGQDQYKVINNFKPTLLGEVVDFQSLLK